MPEFVLPESEWPRMPEPHRAFLRGALPVLRARSSLCGLAAGGSFVSGELDEYSDLDLIVVPAAEAAPLSVADRQEIAASLGPLLVAFTGEHVAEPRLLICLYGGPALHVDLKFQVATDFRHRVEDPVVLWDRHGDLERALASGVAAYPTPDLQWIEDRFWVWVHYAATKIGRGELFEALDLLGALRRMVLGPLALQRAGARPSGVRRVEVLSQGIVSSLVATVGSHDAAACFTALSAAIVSYRDHRSALASPDLVHRSEAESEAVAYLDAVRRALGIDGAA